MEFVNAKNIILMQHRKVIEELRRSRKDFEEIIQAKDKELEETKEEKEKAKAQKEEVLTQMTEVLENELQCIVCSELFIECLFFAMLEIPKNLGLAPERRHLSCLAQPVVMVVINDDDNESSDFSSGSSISSVISTEESSSSWGSDTSSSSENSSYDGFYII
ncbi:UNVERIFIED_CONTAM: hypothetical protein FKN15_057295 [Acipenser sinensis]